MNKQSWKLATTALARYKNRTHQGKVDQIDFLEGYRLGYDQAQKEGKNKANRILRSTAQREVSK